MSKCMGCCFCDNEAQTECDELFPKYIVYNRDTRAAWIVCRDCFELAYRGASEENRNFFPSAQSTVYVGAK